MAAKNRMPREFWIPMLGLVGILVFVFLLGKSTHPHDAPENRLFSEFERPALQTLDLHIPKAALGQLRIARNNALKSGILLGEGKSWVKGQIHEGGKSWKVKIRLKGDWTDHLEGSKWSFRIALRDSSAWRGMKEFSLQHPKTRGFLKEWAFHKMLVQEEVLSPYYDFLELKINGARLGVYAIEEHFGKPLIESQGRKAGMLVKIDESGLWEARMRAQETTDLLYHPMLFFSAAQTLPFQKSSIAKSPSAAAEFNAANQLMQQYRFGLLGPAEIFDIEKSARFLALVDLNRAYHSQIWHNRRFYYNPILQKLEPVAFDGFSGLSSEAMLLGPFLGFGANGNTRYGSRLDVLGTIFFRDPNFVRAYFRCLVRFAHPDFLNSFFATNEEALSKRESLLQQEFFGYRFEREALLRNAEIIHQCLRIFLDPSFFEIEQTNEGNATRYLCIENYSPLPIECWSKRKGEGSAKFMSAFDHQNPAEYADFRISASDEILYKLAGGDSILVLVPPYLGN